MKAYKKYCQKCNRFFCQFVRTLTCLLSSGLLSSVSPDGGWLVLLWAWLWRPVVFELDRKIEGFWSRPGCMEIPKCVPWLFACGLSRCNKIYNFIALRTFREFQFCGSLTRVAFAKFHLPVGSGCPLGRYGRQCRNRCNCGNGVCDSTDGSCRCNPGYAGRNCQKSISPFCCCGSKVILILRCKRR